MTARCAFNGVTLCDNALYDASSGADQGFAIYRSGMSAMFPSIARAPFGLLKYIPETRTRSPIAHPVGSRLSPALS
jgi:hypothetical protein